LLEVVGEETAHPHRPEGPDLYWVAEVTPGYQQADWMAPAGAGQDIRPAEHQAAEGVSDQAMRLPSTVTTLIAARRLEKFMEHNNIGQTDFARV